MKKFGTIPSFLSGGLLMLVSAGFSQEDEAVETVIARPVEINDVLINPGI